MIASQNGHTEVIEQLLKEHPDVNIQNKEGVTCLMKANENGHNQVIEQLLKGVQTLIFRTKMDGML